MSFMAFCHTAPGALTAGGLGSRSRTAPDIYVAALNCTLVHDLVVVWMHHSRKPGTGSVQIIGQGSAWMLSIGSARLPTLLFRTCQHAQRLSAHSRLNLSLHVRQRPAWVATHTSSGARKPHGRPQHQKSTCAYAADQAAPAKPRVMLIGWLGAQKHHLNKCAALTSCLSCIDNLSTKVWDGEPSFFCRYAQLWQSKGYDTSTVQPPTAGIVLPFIGDAAAKKYLEALDKELTDETGLVFHIFRCSAAHIVCKYCLGLHGLRPVAADAATQASCSSAPSCECWRRVSTVVAQTAVAARD